MQSRKSQKNREKTTICENSSFQMNSRKVNEINTIKQHNKQKKTKNCSVSDAKKRESGKNN